MKAKKAAEVIASAITLVTKPRSPISVGKGAEDAEQRACAGRDWAPSPAACATRQQQHDDADGGHEPEDRAPADQGLDLPAEIGRQHRRHHHHHGDAGDLARRLVAAGRVADDGARQREGDAGAGALEHARQQQHGGRVATRRPAPSRATNSAMPALTQGRRPKRSDSGPMISCITRDRDQKQRQRQLDRGVARRRNAGRASASRAPAG